MFRCDDSTRLVNANGSGKDGYTEGNPGTTPATRLRADALNMWQEEIANAVEAFGATLDKTKQNQLARLAPRFRLFTLSSPGGGPNANCGVTDSGSGTSGFSVVSGLAVQVPIAGWYRVSFSAFAARANATNPIDVKMYVSFDNGTGLYTVANQRFSATNGDKVLLSGSFLGHVPTADNAHTISIANPDSESVTISNGHMHVELVLAD